MADKAPEEPVRLPEGAVARGSVVAPPSKSHAIRALICASLSLGMPVNLRVAAGRLPDDVVRTMDALEQLGAEIGPCSDGTLSVVGGVPDSDPSRTLELDVGGSATALRLLAPVCALGNTDWTITGSPQLLRRPVGPIALALEAIGASVQCRTDAAGRLVPPIHIRGGKRPRDEVTVDASTSSHVVSGLLLVAPRLRGGPAAFTVRAAGAVASEPYIELTCRTMADFGAPVERIDGGWRVPNTGYGTPYPFEYAIEGDWSSAAFLFGAAAATGGDVAVTGLDPASVQADRRIDDILRAFGAVVEAAEGGVRAVGRVSRPVDVDLGSSPDLAPLVGALACLVPGTSRVRGAAHLRIKETDRIAEVVRCARAWGCEARELPDGFEISGPARHGATIDPAGDHRLAMAFAVAGLAVPGTRIADPGCVAKSYPAFWQDLASLTGDASLADAAPREPG